MKIFYFPWANHGHFPGFLPLNIRKAIFTLSTVALVRCQSYNEEEVKIAIKYALEHFGGIKSFVKSGVKVLLKPNLLCARSPEKCVTTHPAIVSVVARMVLEAGGKPFIGDSPAIGPFKWVAAKSGLEEVARKLNIELIELTNPIYITPPPESKFKKILIAKQAIEADLVINLPKLKTHSQMMLTLGVKNLFGTIVAQRKAEWHFFAGMNRDTFASLLLDIYLIIKPALTILDGVWGMEGYGPSNGIPRKVGLLAVATDAVALDTSICYLLGGDFGSFPLYREARDRNIGETELSRLNFPAESPLAFYQQNFQIPALDSCLLYTS
ncbi:MAG: DUF362 domain-containing protein, partial [Desulfobacterota bacterium]|nr:DUF362 domain-containing protein [Thermodesulfobacteriota bacterium]